MPLVIDDVGYYSGISQIVAHCLNLVGITSRDVDPMRRGGKRRERVAPGLERLNRSIDNAFVLESRLQRFVDGRADVRQAR